MTLSLPILPNQMLQIHLESFKINMQKESSQK
ncbi:hypothetical protein Natoc_4112 (plasmid) [Natronococcus occultus SP4]|uniref:Uncharacterized protein n=1 Tax=Natronococcus occultus SP4 TaxID=694430 RepID=L0K6T8_9EURY|nr:hypothetical protein Natoc_4112 [Natronococcus occultus SP4]